MREVNPDQLSEYKTFEILTQFREPLIRNILNSQCIGPDSYGLDIGCGIGYITNILGGLVEPAGQVIGLDYSEDLIQYAEKNTQQENIVYHQGDVNHLTYDNNSFDWIWSMDTIWAGPKGFGCPTDDPYPIVKKLHQILKPEGKVFLAFWTSQKLLPGFPLLESRLNSTVQANAPYIENMKPENHILNVKKWLKKASFKNIEAKTYIQDISAPLSEIDKTALLTLFDMFWGNSEAEVLQEDWDQFNKYCSRESEECILNSPDYYGFLTYTLFQGQKQD